MRVQCYGHLKWTTKVFINKSRETHGDTYDYSKSINNKKFIVKSLHGYASIYNAKGEYVLSLA